MSRKRQEYPDDLFAETRMSFGDHIEELRARLISALKGLIFCMVIGFILDAVGSSMGWKNFGVGKPVLEMIKAPVEDQMNNFYDERAWRAMDEHMPEAKSKEEKLRREEEHKKYLERCKKTRDGDTKRLNDGEPLRIELKREELRKAYEDSDNEYAVVTAKIPPVDLALLQRLPQEHVGKRNQLTALSVQEMFMVYFKVTLLCGIVLSSPWLFYQFWMFVGAGLYPHEKRQVYGYLPFSVVMFLCGVFLCFVWVLPGAVKALLAFNEWLGVDPDIRLNEWLSLAIILPLVFGISFQTPLVMIFLNRIGMFTWQDYLSKWRYAIFCIAAFSAVITPTPDAVTMLYLFIPMFGLYMLGILLCKWLPPPGFDEEEEMDNNEKVAV
ncbi:MAG: twin-arginine translocase subunit TatC [Planctomycetes bacterium]|nr:twin-arginine translocase subunit TatC [Planctomycetota bacterium]